MEFPKLLRLLLWALWGLGLVLLTSAGLWGVLSAAGDSVGGLAARWTTIIAALLFSADLTVIIVTLARRELE